MASALAGGVGVYGEVSPGAAWSDASGPLVRGSAARTNFGVFWGPYRSTLQYGRYQRLGLQWGATSIDPTIEGPLAFTLTAGPEYGRGIDLLKLGVYWKVSLNLAFFAEERPNEEPDFTLGAVARLTGAGVYWFTRYLGIVARVEGGPDFRGSRRGFSTGGGLGIGLIARAGVLTRQRKLRAQWEEEDAVALRQPRPIVDPTESMDPTETAEDGPVSLDACTWTEQDGVLTDGEYTSEVVTPIALGDGAPADRIVGLGTCGSAGECLHAVLEACDAGGYRAVWGPSYALGIGRVEGVETLRLRVDGRYRMRPGCDLPFQRHLERDEDGWAEVDRCQGMGIWDASCGPRPEMPSCP